METKAPDTKPTSSYDCEYAPPTSSHLYLDLSHPDSWTYYWLYGTDISRRSISRNPHALCRSTLLICFLLEFPPIAAGTISEHQKSISLKHRQTHPLKVGNILATRENWNSTDVPSSFNYRPTKPTSLGYSYSHGDRGSGTCLGCFNTRPRCNSYSTLM